ncbi:PXA domain-containing protein [Aspergillus coremiiformis]|uniref:PXA domain-containing protein n=1 Tax=Aspergillus coremiiformis TaxID=138285 RepID=A0A5N6YVG0_9EURO|nr:PXA domain-containing protein [Aspergillus coremiiformis]
MSGESSRPGLHPLSHLKAEATTSSSKSTASANLRPSSQASHRPRLQKSSSREIQVDATSDKASIALIRRVLCPQTGNYGNASTPQSLEDLLPPLTSSNEVDRQLYALIAIIFKEFVLSWYSKITSDQILVNEFVQVIAHCTRAVEQRLRDTDVSQLILDEIPALVEAHIISYRLSRAQSQLSGLTPSVHDIYHSINPHPSLSPIPDPTAIHTVTQQAENEARYRQLLVNGVLAVLLPTEDLENVCLRTLVCDILADLIIGNQVGGKMCEGWFLWESITKILDVVGSRPSHEVDATTAVPHEQNQLRKFGLLSPKEDTQKHHSSTKVQLRVPDWVWNVLQFAYLAYVTLRFIVTGIFRVASTPVLSSSPFTTAISCTTEAPPSCSTLWKRPVLDYRLYSMLSQLLGIPRRMPWLGGLLALFQYLILAGPGRFGSTDSVLDRFLHETIQNHVLTPTLLPNLLRASRAALFPSNARSTQAAGANHDHALDPHLHAQPPTPPTETSPASDAAGASNASSSISISATAPSLSPEQRPSAAEIASIKRRCAVSILSLVPRSIARHFLGVPTKLAIGQSPLERQEHLKAPNEQNHQPSETICALSPDQLSDDDLEESLLLETIENEILDLFADEYCNKHLIYSIIEIVLAKLLPELSERSVTELMEDRGVSLDSD